ncbi:tetratricopeptide repeat protein [Halobacillus litoralis]|uniref:tetratricopeptide repeat protein n=1 Tax=Halobacillus litoralis TaxID=45668 RepID=UPI001CFD2674|nr:tetratricopeptide repeat protein [Halobacillus litoralis]
MTTILLKTPKQNGSVDLIPERVVFFEQMQVIEAITDKQECYELFFYKHKFLTAVKTTRMKRSSYIAQAFREGFIYESPHPFIHALVSNNSPLKKLSYPQLKKNLGQQYSKEEQARILTFFESFIPKKHLFEDLKTLFYSYRREGKMASAYMIVRELIRFAPNNRFVKELANDLSFSRLSRLYEEDPAEACIRDPLFAEACADSNGRLLLLEKENRWIESLSLSMQEMSVLPTTQKYSLFTNQMKQRVDDNSYVSLLEELSHSISSFEPLTEELLQIYLRDNNLERLAALVMGDKMDLDTDQLQAIADALETMEIKENIENLTPLVLRLVTNNPATTRPLLENYVISLFLVHDLEGVQEAVSRFPGHLPIIKKIERMCQISEDLNHLLELGEAYYELKQVDQAIECFQMEMELKPSDPQPLRWLAKIYQDKKMVHEAKAYQQLCVDVQKWA